MVGEPSVHVGYPLDREPALAQASFNLGQAGVITSLQSGRLLPDANVLGDPLADDAADPEEPELDCARDLAGYRGMPVGAVPEEDDGPVIRPGP